MSNSSPLIPQGSFLEEQAKGRPHLRIALCIVAVHMVFLGGLLMQGCKREDPSETASLVLPPLEESTNFPALPSFPSMTNIEESVSATQPPPTTDTPPSIGANVLPALPAEPEATNALPSLSPPVAQEPAPQGMTEYTVQKGDYFFSIARKFNLTAADIAQANPGVDSTRLQIGQVLKIPAAGAAGSAPGGSTPALPTGTELYTVKAGDNLTQIARRYGTTVSALKEMNGLVTDRIIINQKLKVPVLSGAGAPGN